MKRTGIASLKLGWDQRIITIDVPDPCIIIGSFIAWDEAATILRAAPRRTPRPALIAIVDPERPRVTRKFFMMKPGEAIDHEAELKFAASIVNPSTGKPHVFFLVTGEAAIAQSEASAIANGAVQDSGGELES